MSRAIETVKAEAAGGASARMAGGERRRQIIEVAMRLFSQRGFRGTTTKEIAQEAGVSEAIIFRHFANKQELYRAILDFKACSGSPADLQSSVADAIRRKDDFAVFYGLALSLIERHENDTEFLRLLTHSALEGHELAAMFWDRNVRGLYEFVGGYVRERQRDGALREIDPRVVVRAFLGTVIHHSLNNTLWDTRRSLLDVSNERAAEEFARILLEGVKARAPRGGDGKPGGGGKSKRRAPSRRKNQRRQSPK
ncbi:MAG: TetR/AcrR family transcriptional regulator [Acidobacteria bacterium]|nr:TetR/AcrR family transcriptional regulator [Acidobacteriota bacterium]